MNLSMVVETYFENMVVLSPHTDDAELGCGGILDKFSRKGSNIHFIAFSW